MGWRSELSSSIVQCNKRHVVMHASRDKDSYPLFSPELVILFGPALVAITAGLILVIFHRTKQGDSTFIFAALALALCGVVLLFFAKLPLYRQRKFFAFGPRLLNRRHRKLYRWGYCFIGASALLLIILNLAF